jgi:hypothetical protein
MIFPNIRTFIGEKNEKKIDHYYEMISLIGSNLPPDPFLFEPAAEHKKE